jgi:hypothetical protein
MAGRIVTSTINDDTGVLATQNGMTGIAKAWVNFNGSSGAINGTAFNVSSVTRNGTGTYTINLTTALTAGYCPVGMTQNTNAMSVQIDGAYNGSATTLTTTALKVNTAQNTTLYDCTNVCVAFLSV